MEALTDTIGLWTSGLRSGMVDVLNIQIELVFMVFPIAAELGASVSQDAK